ncbi:N-acetylglucosamine-6-phosphate deacetylase [Naasia aerilata]|uniref:N-acetylglucosamine-6-phosphate deacetylase n=1 Tax=Naasia aerilata TaxID=1162966 RepID=A0ABN6XJ51_9MICO|nr:N-acetylglucosamine-6-phosphate deacetylase [Naasia aerilata]BDZ44932.1 N-acetylglucosamine-6-phosphate deacetylase [Naasia aerilata]
MTGTVLLAGATAVDADGVRPNVWLLADGGVIAAIGPAGAEPELPPGCERIDATGLSLVPGFLDLHAHGGGGHSYDTGDALAGFASHRAHGTAATLLSLVAAPVDELAARLGALREMSRDEPGILGVHLEGPFLSRERRGAHAEDLLAVPDPASIDRLLEAGAGVLRMVTIAPELPDAMEAIARLAAAGVLVAVGHTQADYERTRAAFDAGARVLTHTFNAMPGLGHRAPGPVAAAIDDPRVTLELILDGRHVHDALARLLFAAAPGRVALITDAMAAAAAGDGEYLLGGREVTVQEGTAVLRGTTTLAGSTLTQDAALRRAIAAGLDPAAAVGALTTAPAAALGLAGRRGRLAPGMPADLVLLDQDWRVVRVLPAGGARSRT